MPAHFEVLPDPSPDDLRQIEPIYVSSFPPAEQVPLSTILRNVRQGIHTLVIARHDNSRISAFALIHRLPGAPLIFLPYLAVDRLYRGRGIGSGLMRYMIDELLRTCDADAMIWEVEPENPANPADETSRRIRFYERLGAEIVTAAGPHYCMPNPAGEGIVPLRLMWVPFCHAPEQPDRAEVARWVRAIYAHDYADHMDLADRIVAGILAEA